MTVAVVAPLPGAWQEQLSRLDGDVKGAVDQLVETVDAPQDSHERAREHNKNCLDFVTAKVQSILRDVFHDLLERADAEAKRIQEGARTVNSIAKAQMAMKSKSSAVTQEFRWKPLHISKRFSLDRRSLVEQIPKFQEWVTVLEGKDTLGKTSRRAAKDALVELAKETQRLGQQLVVELRNHLLKWSQDEINSKSIALKVHDATPFGEYKFLRRGKHQIPFVPNIPFIGRAPYGAEDYITYYQSLTYGRTDIHSTRFPRFRESYEGAELREGAVMIQVDMKVVLHQDPSMLERIRNAASRLCNDVPPNSGGKQPLSLREE